ncbi:MAG: hypothetical protein L0H93_16585, partial [Nocardioides sp.]|nr:hypothetical protein [Nocardioides sp.]
GPSLAVATAELTFRIEEGAEPDGTEVGMIFGRSGDSPYRLEASMRPDGTLWLMAHRGDVLVAEQQLDDMTLEPGAAYTLAVSTSEDDGSALTAKLWETAGTEPADWQLTVTADEIPSDPDSGAVGLTATRADDAGEHVGIVIEEIIASLRG